MLTRLAADSNELQAEELQGQITASGASPIATCGDRERVCVAGTLRAVTFRPHGGAPALEAELWDGTASVTLIWLGRREIAGIHPGRRLRVRGRTTNLRGRRAIYNPAYELQATGAE
ncbi:OB-fold nucleic acid binding domain-containing protein [Streptomyces sp. NPDC054933]